jgi:hypothetical protein
MLGSGEEGLMSHQEVLRSIGAEASKHVPDEADAIIVRVSSLAPTALYAFYAELADGTRASIRMSRQLDRQLFQRLRKVMYRPGLGTWFSAVLRIDRSGSVDGQFNYDDEPEWDAPVDPIAYVTDFEKYPRDAENQPEWLRRMVAEGYARRDARSRGSWP